jgi:oxygen-dependent protoporphyrinogen oxidase
VSAPRVAVVGGGIAGLTAAWRLLHPPDGGEGAEVLVFEAASRFGGKIRTERFDGYTVEAGPDSFLTSKPWALELARALGIDAELTGMNRLKHRAMIRGPHGLQPLPAGLSGLVPAGASGFLRSGLFSVPGRARAAFDLVLPRGRADRDESIAAFVRRRFGPEAWDRFMEPLLAGIHGGDGDSLSLAATFPALAEAERRSGSVIRGLRSMRARGRAGAAASAFVAPRTGMARLIEALLERLEAARLIAATPVVRVSRRDGGWQIDTESTGPVFCDAVVLAVPANLASPLVRVCAPDLAEALASIPFRSAVVVQMAFPASAPARPLDSGGHLNPAWTRRPVSACTWVSAKFEGRAPAGAVLLRAIPRIESRAAFDALTDDRAVALGVAEIRDTLGVNAPPSWARVYRYPDGMPQYTLGHLDRVRAIRELVRELPGLQLAGHSYDGVGIPDAVRSAEAAAAETMAELRRSTPATHH